MNRVFGISWLWRAWRGRSLTFAVLFAGGLVGLSLFGSFRHLLHRWGAPWYVLLLAPWLLVVALSRKEAEWIPDPERRRVWSRRIVLAALALFLLLGWLGPKTHGPPAPPSGNPLSR